MKVVTESQVWEIGIQFRECQLQVSHFDDATFPCSQGQLPSFLSSTSLVPKLRLGMLLFESLCFKPIEWASYGK